MQATQAKRDSVICVKIAQRKLRHTKTRPAYDYFPYDRVYLVRTKIAPIFRKTFRYYLSMPLTKDLLHALNSLNVSDIRESTVIRDDNRRAGSPGRAQDNFQDRNLVRNPKGWTMIVPTHVKSKYRDTKNFKNPYASEVVYLMTRAIQRGHNNQVSMPQIAFHTPNRVIPLLCAACKCLPQFHTGECSPGTHKCREQIESELPLDSDLFRNSMRSIEEIGGDA